MDDKKAFQINTAKAAGKKRVLNARKDTPDIRDRMYEPALVSLKPTMDNRGSVPVILDQGTDGACTGFGLAAVINLLYADRDKKADRKNRKFRVSPRMLYEMAKMHDEWPGEDYTGSSCRGAIRGWKNMGVCSETLWPYKPNKPGEITIKRATDARSHALGAYYRLRAELNDYHAALNEVGAIYVSANVHSGWFNPEAQGNAKLATIQPNATVSGGHAFAIVGYNNDGFIVQNSWGEKWGSDGFALWLYEDWVANISDGWVFRLALPTPQVFGLTARTLAKSEAEIGKVAPKRMDIAGHFVHFDNGALKEHGDYWSTLSDIQNTADRIKDSVAQDTYQHLLIYAHGGLNTPTDSALRIVALKDGFKRNGVYPFHVMYDTGLVKELKDTVIRAYHSERMEGFLGELKEKLTDVSDKLIEDIVRKPVTPVWEEMKRDARTPFVVDGDREPDGAAVIRIFAETLRGTGIQIHLAGHSTGSILLGYLLNALDSLKMPELIASCSLMAPACTLDFFEAHYAGRLAKSAANAPLESLPVLDIYNMTDELERDDNVAEVYRKSLLYLVSRALERTIDKPILGMQRYSSTLAPVPGMNIHYSDGKTGDITRSTSHGGFDNDIWTMNSILKRILGKDPELPFLEREMKGY